MAWLNYFLSVLLLAASPARIAADTWRWQELGRINPPAGRIYLTAVWTGREFLFWGGRLLEGSDDWRNGGFRYDPRTDNWKAMSTVRAPDPRYAHSAIWTGRELIIWGGRSPTGQREESYNTGARYDPMTDSWTPVSMAGAPARRDSHTAIWTGKEMIVWAGFSVGYPDTWNDGGRYDPVTDSWKPLTLANAPNARQDHAAVWTGHEMLVWGGRRLLLRENEDFKPLSYFVYPADLGRYDPATDTWITKYSYGAPEVRATHSAVWTGQEMIIWGGVTHRSRDSRQVLINDGGRFDPLTESWTLTSSSAAPTGRGQHIGLWTGTEMIILGGSGEGNSGARYDPALDLWTPITLEGAPRDSLANSAAWTGEGMLVFHDHLSFYFEPGLYAGDHLPDLWQRRYFGDNNPDGLPAADPDQDGQDNLHEYLAGTEPTEASSRFSFRVEKIGTQPGSIKLSFSPRLEDRSYQIQVSTNLVSDAFAPLAGSSAQSDDAVLEVNATDLARFYRVRISLP
ncbi:MAG: hypothetical protein L0Z50_13245 [Verrucomicrobiales bacterium]|nr:hypothetical protein [Verrucomicrobiales bacterium]